MGVEVVHGIVEVVGIKRYSDRVMKVNVIIGDAVWELISCYSLQTGGCANEK